MDKESFLKPFAVEPLSKDASMYVLERLVALYSGVAVLLVSYLVSYCMHRFSGCLLLLCF